MEIEIVAVLLQLAVQTISELQMVLLLLACWTWQLVVWSAPVLWEVD